MGRKPITHEEFMDKFYKQNTHANDIQILGTYVNNHTKILCKCKIDGNEWEGTPNNLLKGTGCPKCSGNIQLTHEEFLKRLYEVNPKAANIQVLEKYITRATPIKCKCKVCGHEWKVAPHDLFKGGGCPKCAKKKRTKTHNQFLQELQEINPDIQILGTYVNSKTKILCKCKIDDYEWETTPVSLLQGTGCPICGGKMKKTHEQFLQELQQINPDIEVLGTYVNGKTKILCKCKLDGYEWETTPDILLRGSGCPICARKRVGEQQTKTHEQFIQELQQINSDIEVLGTYVNSQTKIKCKCKICGYEWEVTPNSLLRGTGCPKCAVKTVTQKKVYSHEQFMEKFNTKNTHAKDIEILGTYVNSQTKILCKCKIDDYEWEARPASLLYGYGCPICGGNINKTHEQFIEELQQINQNIEVLGTYVNTDTKIKCKCKLDGYEWEVRPVSLLRGIGCPKCSGKIKDKTTEYFISELKEINDNIEILGEYKGCKTKIKCKCKKDGCEWEAIPSDLLRGHGCPKCSITKGEKRVAQYLDNLDIDYIYNKGYFNDLIGVKGGVLRPDFIIPSLKIWIEYDGIQHFEPVDFSGKMSDEQVQEQFKQVQQNDKIKNQYAKDHNWTLVRIAYWDIDNIEQILDAVLKQEQAI